MANTIGRYEIIDKIGQGGMGAVYKAFDPLLRRTVAVKVISTPLVDKPDTRERFFREARAAGQLSHRNIIVIHDLGEEAGQPYLAMEFLTGGSLETRLAGGGRLSAERAVDVMIDVCDALEYAHARGVVHRDVKPANLFLTDDDEVKILDFGLAHLVASELTRSETIMGTANYMAPEQVRGERVDRRADIFSAGTVLYELLTGRRAFEGDSFANTLYQVLERTPEPVHTHDPTIPLPLAAVVERALAKRREDRHQSAAEMMRELMISREALAPVHRYPPDGDAMPTVLVDGSGAPRPRLSGAREPTPSPSGRAAVEMPLGPPAPPRAPSVIWSPRRLRTTALVGGVLAIAAVAALLPRLDDATRDEPEATAQPQPGLAAPAVPAVVEPSPASPAPPQAPAPEPARPAPAPPATPAPATRAPEPRVATAAERRTADAALEGVTRARSQAEAAGAESLAAASYRTAIGTEGEARGLYAAGDFRRAASRAADAEALFRRVEIEARAAAAARDALRAQPATPPPPAVEPERPAPQAPPRPEPAPPAAAPPPVETPPAVEHREAIRIVLARYVAALEGRNVDALRAIWPSLGGAQERAIRAEFDNARSLQVRVPDPQIEVSGSAATVTAMRQYDLVTNDNQRLTTTTRMTMRLRRNGNGWVVESVTYQ